MDAHAASANEIRATHNLPPRTRRIDAEHQQALNAATDAGERSHILTLGSPAQGIALRITRGTLDKHARWHANRPDIFLIWQGKRVNDPKAWHVITLIAGILLVRYRMTAPTLDLE